MLHRRALLALMGASGLSACMGGAVSRASGPDPKMRPQPNAGFDAWLDGFRPRARAAGIGEGTLNTGLRSAGWIPGVVERDRNQTEFTRTTEDYLAIAVSDERLATGRAAVSQHGRVLQAVEARYGVDRHIVAAVWGLESFFGTRRGDVPVISALATLAYDGRRGAFFESQLIAALKILQAGDVTADRMVGSWAGAMGHTQFIPTSYLAFAVDFTGDGRRDIWSDDPSDALASTAAYLAKNGWASGGRWGLEVAVPAGFDTGLAGRGKGRAVSDWRALGLRAADGGAIPDHGAASLILPAGPTGPGFLIFRNFNAILRYNNAENYALGIGHLADRLAGGGPIIGRFPPDATGLTLEDRKDIQRRLTARGYDTQGSDGVIGAKSRSAISAFQAANGMAVTGEPSVELLRALR